MPHRSGTDVAGFELTANQATRLVTIRMWGLWSLETCEPYGAAILKEVDAFLMSDCALLFEASQWPPQRPDVQDVVVEAWRSAERSRARVAVVMADNPLTRLQVRRLLTEAGLKRFVLAKSDAEARVLLEERK